MCDGVMGSMICVGVMRCGGYDGWSGMSEVR